MKINKGRVINHAKIDATIGSPNKGPAVSSSFKEAAAATSWMTHPSVMEALALINRVQQEDTTPKASKGEKPVAAVINLDDVLEGIDKDRLLARFSAAKQSFKLEMIDLASDSLAIQSAIQDTQAAITNIVSDKIELDLGSLSVLVERTSETKFLSLLMKTLDIDSKMQTRIHEQYVLRRWGPEPARAASTGLRDIIVNADGKSTRQRGGAKQGQPKGTDPRTGNPIPIGLMSTFRS